MSADSGKRANFQVGYVAVWSGRRAFALGIIGKQLAAWQVLAISRTTHKGAGPGLDQPTATAACQRPAVALDIRRRLLQRLRSSKCP